MQALDLLPPAPVSSNGAEQPSNTSLRNPAVPDGEFGRMMERAMSPAEKDKADTNPTPRKGKATVASAKGQPGKTQLNQDTTAADPDVATDKTEKCDKSQAVSGQPVEPATKSKEKTEADATSALPLATDNTAKPLPVFLSLPLMGQFTNGGTEAKTTMVKGNASAQPVPVIGLGTIATGKNPSAAAPEKNVQTATLISSLDNKTPADATVAKSVKPGTDAKNSLPSTMTGSTPQPETAKTENTAPTALKPETTTLASDKFQAVAPVAAKPAETSKNDGTGAAITASSMKKTENTNKVAGLDVQVLPGGKTDAARDTVLPAHAAVAPVRASDKQTSDFNLPLAPANPTVADAAETASIISLPSLTDARMRDVERTHDLVSLHALRMVDSKSDSLQVVIKPGGGTELSLELRHRNGTLEAEAVLQRGDYQLMNQHWPELQQKLEQRGIKLAPLGGDTNFSAPDNGNFSRQQQSTREEAAQQASAFAEFTVAMNRGGATARLAPVTAGGWESWA